MTFMLMSLRRPNWLKLTLMSTVSVSLLNAPTATAQSVTSNPQPIAQREQFQALPLPPMSPFWTLPNLGSINSPNQLIQQFYAQTLTPQQLGEGDSGCFRSQSATIQRLTPQSVAVILTQMGSCDDSLSGQQTRVDFSAQGDRWRVDWVGQRNHCRGEFWADPGQLCP